MTLARMLEKFFEEYANAKDSSFVYKPISYALFQTWKWCDVLEECRRLKNEDDD